MEVSVYGALNVKIYNYLLIHSIVFFFKRIMFININLKRTIDLWYIILPKESENANDKHKSQDCMAIIIRPSCGTV